MKSFREQLDESLEEKVTNKDLDDIEKFADKLFAKLDVDVNFTKHFGDRVNDPRNKTDITKSELIALFKKTYRQHGKAIASMDDHAEAVIKDIQKDINLPFVLNYNKKTKELDLVAKTIMRKKDFKTHSPELKV